jgi:hypothetical protein
MAPAEGRCCEEQEANTIRAIATPSVLVPGMTSLRFSIT